MNIVVTQGCLPTKINFEYKMYGYTTGKYIFPDTIITLAT